MQPLAKFLENHLHQNQRKNKMAIKRFTYISGPRMGQNNFMYGIELKNAPKPVKAPRVNTSKQKRKKK
jgi:hypothetical protein